MQDGNFLMQLKDIARSGRFNFGEKPIFTLSYTSSSNSAEVELKPEEVDDFSRAIRFYEGDKNMKKFKYTYEVSTLLT